MLDNSWNDWRIYMPISKRVLEIEESKTLASAQKARELIAEGKDIISLTIGEPDLNTPKFIQEAAINATMSNQADHYTPVNGIIELRQAISNSYNNKYETNYDINDIFVGSGLKNVLYNLFQVLLDPEDEVILPLPYWVSFAEQIKLANGKIVLAKNSSLKVTIEDLDKLVSSKTKILLINSPSNPSGAVYTLAEMEAIGKWAIENNVLIIADEIYNTLVYNGQEQTSFAMLNKDIRNQTIILNGVSKTYAMTGWRIGFAISNKVITKALNNFASHSNGNPAAVSQYAALAAYKDETNVAEEMRLIFEDRLNKAYELMKDIPGFKLDYKPQGAFYLFPNVKAAASMCGYSSVDDFNNALLTEALVACVPGSAFGMDDHLRFSYAIDSHNFERAMDRIRSFIKDKTIYK